MPISKLIGRGVGAASRFGGAKGKNRLVADLDDDVVKETKSDIEQIRRAMRLSGDSREEPTSRGVARQSAIEGGGRAMMRTGSRAGAAGAALAAGVSVGTTARDKAEETRRKVADDEDKTPKRVAVASRSMDDDAPSRGETTAKKMSFKEAFASARKDGDKTFTWQGKRYTTETAEDGPKSSVREGKNQNIDEDTRKKAMEFSKGGSIPTVYAGAKKPSASAVKGLPRPVSTKVKSPVTKMAKGGAVKGKKK